MRIRLWMLQLLELVWIVSVRTQAVLPSFHTTSIPQKEKMPALTPVKIYILFNYSVLKFYINHSFLSRLLAQLMHEHYKMHEIVLFYHPSTSLKAHAV